MYQKDQKKWYRVNQQIRVSPIMVILGDKNLGTMSTERALVLASREGLDLVEIAPAAKPPVCKIIDYGKFRYEQSIKERKSKAQAKIQQLKEIRLRPSIAIHDLEVKINSAQKFLETGNRVQVRIKFTSRENIHKELGFNLINKVIDSLISYGKPLSSPQLEGKWLGCIIEPKKI